MATTRLVTIKDLEQITDDYRYDLIRGKLIRMTPAGAHHGEYAVNIIVPLAGHVSSRRLGKVYTAESGFILAKNPDVLLCPDVAFVRHDRLPSESEQEGFLELAPDLAVEIVSPSDRARDVAAKVREYLDGGTGAVWVVEPRRRSVTVHPQGGTAQVFGIADRLDGGAVLPGFRLAVRDIFGVADVS